MDKTVLEETTETKVETTDAPGRQPPPERATPLGGNPASNNGRTTREHDNLTETSERHGTGIDPSRAKKNRGLWYVLIGVVALGLVIAAAVFLNRRANVAPAEKATPDAETPSSVTTLSPEQRAAIAVEVVQQRTLQGDVVAPGKVAFNGNKVTPVFSQFTGRIVRLDAEVGSTMRAGQVLGTIDTPDIVGMQSDFLQSLTAERSARTTLELAKRTRERAERLAAAEAIPQRDLQQAQADESRAADDMQRTQSAVVAARGRLRSAGMSDDEINRLASGSHSVNRLVPLVAPISGTVTERKAGLGQVVQPGAGDPLFMIADLSSVWVNADVYEDQLSFIHVGGAVKITTPAYPNETFEARVDQIGATLDPDKHTVAVRCVVPNGAKRLKPGMFASVILRSAGPQTAITVPASAVLAEGDQRSVFVEESPGNYVKRAVETGNEIDGAVIIHSGLKEGEHVVTRGSLLIAGG
jgi:cobalt-zinc-cadmium efflux system membrane fusion protein